MSKKEVHVVPNANGWGVKISGNQKASKVVETKAEAFDFGREKAIDMHTELVVHNKNGKIGMKNSYGNDPRNIKG